MTAVVETFGASLRWWRTNRRYSQMQLANEAEVSSRHLSFLETGRASPSREMVIHLSHVLDLSLRDRNALLHAAGFAPVYPQSEMDAPEMDDVRRMLSRILRAHQPNPAAVIDRRGDLLDANEAALSLVAATVAPDSPALLPQVNVYRLALHPMGLRPSLTNWDAVAAALVGRLEREQAHRPADPALQAVVEEMLTYRDVAEFRARPAVPTGAELLVPLDLVLRDGRRLRLVSTIATVGAPFDVTLEELRLETFFAVDDDGRAVLEAGLS
ncbi:MAG: helix-turn-helix transcriptional regulator [Actinomycetota bacterium]